VTKSAFPVATATRTAAAQLVERGTQQFLRQHPRHRSGGDASTPATLGEVLAALAAPTALGGFSCHPSWTAIQSAANGRYVTPYVNGDLYADGTFVGGEQLYRICRDDGWGVDQFAIMAGSNGLWVTTHIDGPGEWYGYLAADSNFLGGWQLFTIKPFGSHVTFKSVANGRYVSAALDWNYAPVMANASSLGGWELFNRINV